MIELLEAPGGPGAGWQMAVGERATVVGVLSQLKPALAIEIGSAGGGSLACIASHAVEVHSFDLVEPSSEIQALPNVTLHTGDSHELLAQVLRDFELQGRNVDFALVDGDHTSEGVRRDVEDLLSSAAVTRTIILLHDTANEEVRAGLDAIGIADQPKVKATDLEFVPGYLVRGGPFHHEIWGGLGLIVVDESAPDGHHMNLLSEAAYPAWEILVEHRKRIVAGAGEPLDTRIATLEQQLATVTNSRSWRMTAPLRRIAARLRS